MRVLYLDRDKNNESYQQCKNGRLGPVGKDEAPLLLAGPQQLVFPLARGLQQHAREDPHHGCVKSRFYTTSSLLGI